MFIIWITLVDSCLFNHADYRGNTKVVEREFESVMFSWEAEPDGCNFHAVLRMHLPIS